MLDNNLLCFDTNLHGHILKKVHAIGRKISSLFCGEPLDILETAFDTFLLLRRGKEFQECNTLHTRN